MYEIISQEVETLSFMGKLLDENFILGAHICQTYNVVNG